MKQLNIWKTSFYTMLAIAAGAFTACVDDDVDKQAPTLELSEEAVAFTGTATEDATVTVRSNRQWTVAYEDEETQKEWMYFKVSGNEVSEGIYNGDGTVKITVGESAQPHMGRLIFTLSNSYGELYRKYLTVTQGNYVPPTVGAVGKLVEYILGNSDLSGAVGSDKAMPLQYSESTIEAVILANDAAGNNNRKLYVGDNNGLERSAIVLYGADFAMANDPVTKYPAGRKVTLNLENAKYYAFNNVRQLTDVVVTVGDEEVELVVPSLSVEKFNTGDYQAQYVKLNNMTPAQSFGRQAVDGNRKPVGNTQRRFGQDTDRLHEQGAVRHRIRRHVRGRQDRHDLRRGRNLSRKRTAHPDQKGRYRGSKHGSGGGYGSRPDAGRRDLL